MPSDTFAAGIEAAAKLAETWREENKAQADKDRKNGNVSMADRLDGAAVECNAFAAAIRALTPTASEATAIGAGEVKITAFDIIADNLRAASPKVASDTAPGVETFSEDDIRVVIRASIAQTGCSQNQFAREKGITPTKLSEFLTGQRPASIHLLYACGFKNAIVRHNDDDADLAASPTASDTDTAIPAGEACYLIHKDGYYFRRMKGATSHRSEADRYTLHEAVFYSHPNGLTGLREGIDYTLADAASPKPDTDTPVDPGVEAVRTSAALALMYLQTGFIACDTCGREMPTKDLDAALELARVVKPLSADWSPPDPLAAKPIAGMDAGEVEDA